MKHLNVHFPILHPFMSLSLSLLSFLLFPLSLSLYTDVDDDDDSVLNPSASPLVLVGPVEFKMAIARID